MNELPTGWEEARLLDLCQPKQWKVISTSELTDTGYVVYGANGKIGFYSTYTHENPTLMITCRGATCGNLHISEAQSYINGNAMALDKLAEQATSISYLKYALLARGLTDVITGTAQPQITRQSLSEVMVKLAPLAEQTRIATKLDELLAQVDTLKARIDGVPKLLKRFRQSVLTAAVSAQLTEEWRVKNTNYSNINVNPKAKYLSTEELAGAEELLGKPLPSSWEKYALEQLVEPERGIPYGIVQTGVAVSEGVPTVRCGDIKSLCIDTSDLKIVSQDIEQDYKRTRLKGGEVLLAIRGSVGNAGVASESLRNCNISREVAMIPTIPSVLPLYLAYLLQSPIGQRLLVSKVRGVAQKGINLADVKRLPVALPPYEEQTEIVFRVEQFFAYADQLQAKVDAARKRIDQMTQSILAKAFRGELVPQDPSDEPANVLLDRIKAQRAATPNAKRGRRSVMAS